jgi:hypothetical protein
VSSSSSSSFFFFFFRLLNRHQVAAKMPNVAWVSAADSFAMCATAMPRGSPKNAEVWGVFFFNNSFFYSFVGVPCVKLNS